MIAPSHEVVPWLLDSLLAFREVQKQWGAVTHDSSTPVIRSIIELSTTYNSHFLEETVLRNKIDHLLLLLCCTMTGERAELLAEGDEGVAARETFCVAIAHIALAASASRSVARLASSQLLGAVEKLANENTAIGDGTDFSVCPLISPHQDRTNLFRNLLSCLKLPSKTRRLPVSMKH